MSLNRRDPFLNDAISVLDQAFYDHKQSVVDTLASLSTVEKEFIRHEIEQCQGNERYYLENYHVIPDAKRVGFRSLYPLWDSQEIFLDHYYRLKLALKPIRLLILKARQLGLSTISEGLIFHRTIFTEGWNSLVVAQDPGQADYLFSMCRRAYDSLPWWLRPERRYEAKGKYLTLDRNDPGERLMSPGLRSEIFVEAANKISGVAVGKGINGFHGSEMSLWATSTVLTEQILPTLEGREDVLAILESTARGRDNFFYKFWKQAISGELEWETIFIESFRVSRYSIAIENPADFILTEDEKLLRDKAKLEKQFDIPDEHFNWRRQKMKEFEAMDDEWGFFQEYPAFSWVEAFQSSSLCAYNKKKLQKILDTTCCEPRWFGEIDLDDDAKNRGVLNLPKVRLRNLKKEGLSAPPAAETYGSRFYVWEPPEDGEMYYLGCDVAHGIKGGDFSCVEVIRIGRGMQPDHQVAEWHGWISPEPYASVIAAIGYWYNTAQIAVESNDVGILTNNTLFRSLEYPNVFRWKQYDKIKNFVTNWFGWLTNMKTRDQIISKMANAIDQNVIVIRSSYLIDEMFDFGQEGKRFTALTGNDDRVMSFQICYWCAHDSEFGLRAADMPPQLTREEKEQMKSKDFSNSDYSPVYDNPMSTRARLHRQEGIPAEVLMYADQEIGPSADEEDSWKIG